PIPIPGSCSLFLLFIRYLRVLNGAAHKNQRNIIRWKTLPFCTRFEGIYSYPCRNIGNWLQTLDSARRFADPIGGKVRRAGRARSAHLGLLKPRTGDAGGSGLPEDELRTTSGRCRFELRRAPPRA